ncbi:MAG TPA: tRNA pseudouridine(55) synthase TruB, partial [Stellaceae bacterium]|nr:tRNA pseudouridine(55) synthase TruB [Stellaceae bacterium]
MGASGLHGWLVIDKPYGVTSARVVAAIKRSSGAKVGHAGTLDPLATGVLPLALGEATKTARFAVGGRKRYRFRIRWGEARDTDDREGALVGESAARPDAAAILAALPRLTGTILQRPPAYSAIKLAGRRAYALARAGRMPELAARPVEIAELHLL